MHMVSLLVVLLYVGLFVWQCIKHRAWRWLSISMAAWLVTGAVGDYLLPSVAGIGHSVNLYLVHFYVFLGSVTYIGSQRLRQSNSYLYYLARSGWLQYLALLIWGILCLLFVHQFWLIPIGVSLLQMIVLQPLFWLGSQWILMLFLYIQHHDHTSRKQSLLSWVVLWQAVYVLADIYGWI